MPTHCTLTTISNKQLRIRQMKEDCARGRRCVAERERGGGGGEERAGEASCPAMIRGRPTTPAGTPLPKPAAPVCLFPSPPLPLTRIPSPPSLPRAHETSILTRLVCSHTRTFDECPHRPNIQRLWQQDVAARDRPVIIHGDLAFNLPCVSRDQCDQRLEAEVLWG